MENYKKGKNVEEPLDKTQILIKDLPDDFLWMHVNPGTKMKNVLEYAFEEIKSRDVVVWSGSGAAVGKVISCVEIMKRHQRLHQVNKICFRKVKEYWDPLLDDLDPIVVVRDVPTIHILLSKTPLDPLQQGYQPPIGKSDQRSNPSKQQHKSQRRKINSNQLESFGLRSARTKTLKKKPDNTQESICFSHKPKSGQLMEVEESISKVKDSRNKKSHDVSTSEVR